MKYFALILLLVILLFVLIEVVLFLKPVYVRETLIEINNGETAIEIAEDLFQNGIIRNRSWFYLYINLTGVTKNLSYGKYLFFGYYSLPQVVNKIVSGEIYLKKITIPEGYSVKRTSKRFSRKKFGDYQRFRQLCNDSTFAKRLTGFSIPSLEGFLYPETYHFAEDTSEEKILEHMVKRFFIETADMDFAPNKKLDFYETIILASIIEREAFYDDEKPLIAGVYLNRIDYGMKLQADPTIAYILDKYGQTRKKIYYRDLEIDSPYNTYKNRGLPPTPICSPSWVSIKAVLEPESSDYLFFFANRKGRHIFSETYNQHLSKQQQLKKKYGT